MMTDFYITFNVKAKDEHIKIGSENEKGVNPKHKRLAERMFNMNSKYNE